MHEFKNWIFIFKDTLNGDPFQSPKKAKLFRTRSPAQGLRYDAHRHLAHTILRQHFSKSEPRKKTICVANSSCTRPEGHALPRHARYHGQTLIDLQRQSLRTFGFSDCQDFVERPFSVERARSHPTLPASSQKPAASSHQPLVSSQQPLQLPVSSQRPTGQ